MNNLAWKTNKGKQMSFEVRFDPPKPQAKPSNEQKLSNDEYEDVTLLWNSKKAQWSEFSTIDDILSTPNDMIDRNNSSLHQKNINIVSNEYSGLSEYEIEMYESVNETCTNILKIIMPHDLLKLIILFSQGFKFLEGDQVVVFKIGVFGESDYGTIKQMLDPSAEDAENDGNYYYLVKIRNVQTRRIPLHHIFSNKFIIIDKKHKFYDGKIVTLTDLSFHVEKQYLQKQKKYVNKPILTFHFNPTKFERLTIQYDENVMRQVMVRKKLKIAKD